MEKNDLSKESIVRFGGIVLFLLFLVTHLPDPELFLTALDQGGMDPSWIRILCYVHQQNLQFGRDVIFTYGPLGYLLFPYDPTQLFISSLFTVALLLPFGFIFIRKRTVTSLFFLLLFTFLSLFHTIYIANPSYEVFIFLFPLLIWNISEEKNLKIKYGLILYCCITGAACILVKFMSAPIILLSLLVADILLLKRNKVVLAIPALLLFLLLIWCFPVRQNLSNFYSFLVYSWHIASGYNNVMVMALASESPLWIPWLWLNAAVLLFPALFANRKHEPRISAVDRICFILLLALILFIAGKYGIVRMDPWHIIPAVHYMILIAAFCSVMPGIALKWRIVLITPAILLTVSIAVCYGERVFSANCTNMLLVFLAALLIYVLNSCAASNHVSRIIRVSVSAVFIFLAGYKFFLPWAVGQINNYRSFSKHVPVIFADIPQDSPVTADCFSHEIFYLLQSKVKYAPRFVFQSYSAYTPQLLQKNASHFEYDSGPDYIFLGWQEIDGKLPSSFDSLSLLKIMNNYEPVPGKLLLRKKKSRPPVVHLEEIRTEHSDFDCSIDLPQKEPFVWISIDFRESAAGFLLKYLVKPSSVLMHLTLENGQSFFHLIDPGTCSIPFLLSPYLPSWQCLDGMLTSGGRDFPKVVSISVFPFFRCFSYSDGNSLEPFFKSGIQWDHDIGRSFFKEGIKVHFYRMASSSVNQEKQKP